MGHRQATGDVVGNIGPDISYDELRKQHADAVRTIVELRERAEKAERRVARLQMLYDSSMRIVRRYQAERESFLSRVQAALFGIEHVDKRFPKD
jgi:hypothetical protein